MHVEKKYKKENVVSAFFDSFFKVEKALKSSDVSPKLTKEVLQKDHSYYCGLSWALS